MITSLENMSLISKFDKTGAVISLKFFVLLCLTGLRFGLTLRSVVKGRHCSCCCNIDRHAGGYRKGRAGRVAKRLLDPSLISDFVEAIAMQDVPVFCAISEFRTTQ